MAQDASEPPGYPHGLEGSSSSPITCIAPCLEVRSVQLHRVGWVLHQSWKILNYLQVNVAVPKLFCPIPCQGTERKMVAMLANALMLCPTGGPKLRMAEALPHRAPSSVLTAEVLQGWIQKKPRSQMSSFTPLGLFPQISSEKRCCYLPRLYWAWTRHIWVNYLTSWFLENFSCLLLHTSCP